MKRKTSKEILAESFHEVAEKKNIDKITVKDITDNCGYSPATFYRQFTDKYALIAWDYTRELEEILSEVDGTIEGLNKALRGVAEFFQERRGYLANLFLHTGGLEAFITCMQDIHYESLKDIVQKGAGNQHIDSITDMYIRLYVLGTAQLSSEWILGRWEATTEDLAKVYQETFPQPLKKYLK
ncbi:TetR family transcriptional regulator [Pseudobutyrivibrio xylanivorans]|uniref:Transcriptional regulator, TetR family n=1 Tax=Pseudobutyrivibrio xylanivorans TaxID=185007 RepID=A0A1G5S6W6_PSEXY|nr:TetR family transcriptional regulator [Pseudobutyrivibrio xylanivorans]SCZ81309.1 transcriptional regulator, TetR family [Pseudobutyrivibrio xylanivorans]